MTTHPSNPRRNTGRRLAVGLAIAALAVWLGKLGYGLFCFETTDDAYVTGPIHQVSPQIDGTVLEVLATDNQSVRRQQTLVLLDPLEATLGLQNAEAMYARAQAAEAKSQAEVVESEARLAEARTRIAQTDALVAQARFQADLARTNRDRNRQLFQDGGAITRSDLDTAESASSSINAGVEAAQAAAAAARAQVEMAQATAVASKAEALETHAASAAGETAIAEARRKLACTKLTAPADGRVGNKSVEVGNRVQTGQTLLEIVEPHPWVVANVKETQIAEMRIGMAAEVTIDAIPNRTLHGTLESIAPASGAQFALLPADNATGNFTKVVQRVPVKIALDPSDLSELGDKIRPGLSAIVTIRVR